MIRKGIYIAVVFFFVSSVASAQLSQVDSFDVNMNLDSLIADSIRKEFILTHKPLTAAEMNSVVLQKGTLHYGRYLQYYMQQVESYATFQSASRLYVSRKEHTQHEWIFYVFISLLLFLAWVNHSNPIYLRNVFRVYVNEGFVFRQTKDQMDQSVFTSFLYNILFVLSGTTFLFFGTGMNEVSSGWQRWAFLGAGCLLIVLVYVVKFIFLSLMGWLFEEKESFGNYIFLVYLNAKVIGLIMLIASLMMAFSEKAEALQLFKWIGIGIIAMTVVRLFRGFAVFSRKASLPVYLFFVLTLELIPNALLIKFFSSNYSLLVYGLF